MGESSALYLEVVESLLSEMGFSQLSCAGSKLGHVRSALIATQFCSPAKCREGPKADSCTAAKGSLFDHLVGGLQESFRDSETKGLSGLEIHNQHVLGWELNRQIVWLRAFENEIGI
jgi:hypothetical protein